MNLKKETNENDFIDVLKNSFDKEDIIITGENSIAKGIGIARARDVLNKKYNIISLIESTDISFGTIMESLEIVGENDTRMIVVLKDVLQKDSKKSIVHKLIKKLKNKSEGISIFKSYFENLGFKYIGPIEEKNEDKVVKALESSKGSSVPILIHIVSKVNEEVEECSSNKQLELIEEKVSKIVENNEKIAIINYKEGCFSKIQEEIPSRFFVVFKNNKNEIDSIIGMAQYGLIPLVILGSDEIKGDFEKLISRAANKDLPIVFLIANDNKKDIHSSSFDIPYLSTVAGLTVMNSKNIEEASKMIEFAVKLEKTCVIKLNNVEANTDICRKIKLGKAELLKEGNNITIVASGNCVSKALKIEEMLAKSGIEAEVINARFIKPLDREMINRSIEKTGFLVTLEDNYLSGGMGQSINSMLENEVKILNIGYNEEALNELQNNPEIDDLLDEEKIYYKIMKSLDNNVEVSESNMRLYKSKDEVNGYNNEKVGNL